MRTLKRKLLVGALAAASLSLFAGATTPVNAASTSSTLPHAGAPAQPYSYAAPNTVTGQSTTTSQTSGWIRGYCIMQPVASGHWWGGVLDDSVERSLARNALD